MFRDRSILVVVAALLATSGDTFSQVSQDEIKIRDPGMPVLSRQEKPCMSLPSKFGQSCLGPRPRPIPWCKPLWRREDHPSSNKRPS
jgi:hypothetical protein